MWGWCLERDDRREGQIRGAGWGSLLPLTLGSCLRSRSASVPNGYDLPLLQSHKIYI